MLFEPEEMFPWAAEWQDMPEFSVDDLSPRFSIIVNFLCAQDVEDFGKVVGQKIVANENARQLQSVWFPQQEIGRLVNKRYVGR